MIDIFTPDVKHVDSFYECMDSIAKERIHFAITSSYTRGQISSWIMRFRMKGWPIVIAAEDDKVVGFASVVPETGEGRDHWGTLIMGVQDGYRGQGIGKRLLASVVSKAQAAGLVRIELWVRERNTSAIALYQRFGFQVTGRRTGCTKLAGQEVEDEILMEKSYENVRTI